MRWTDNITQVRGSETHSTDNTLKLYVSEKARVFFDLSWYSATRGYHGAVKRISGGADKFLSCRLQAAGLVCDQAYWDYGVRRFVIKFDSQSGACAFDLVYAKEKEARRIRLPYDEIEGVTVSAKSCTVQAGNIFQQP